MILWPLGGYTFCDGLSNGEEEGIRGDLKDDIKIALVGPLAHIPMCLFWVAMYAAVNHGDMSDFSFRNYLTVISSGYKGFLSTLFEQSCLINILLLWFNLFIPVYPFDGGRLMTSSMLMMGVALNKAALLTFFASIVLSVALFAWSIVSIVDGVGITGILTLLVPFHMWSECHQLYSSIVGGRLSEHPLFGRDCYIHRDSVPSIFQLSNAARNAANTNTTGEEPEQNENVTVNPTETDFDQITYVDVE
jgi:Zn-dependent protease